MREDLLYKIALTKIPKVGAVTAKNLISYCGGVAAVFEATRRSLLKIPGIGQQLVSNICSPDILKQAEEELDFIERQEIKPLFFLDADYPYRLKALYDAPIMLYYKGTISLNTERIISIVGTRQPSERGIARCQTLISGLAPYQPLIISGLAYGVDITAHRAALQYQLPTIGVLAHGLQQIYPAAHRKIAHQMLEQGGLLTEYCSDTPPDRERFPMRNRIVAGMADALLVIETKARGGSMITAKVANLYNKDVMAVPGRIGDEQSAGCNLLIKSHQAHLVESVEDICYVLGWEAPEQEGKQSVQGTLFDTWPPEQRTVYELLKQQGILHIDQLCHLAQLPASSVATILLNLEFIGHLKSLPGKRYMAV